MFTVLVLRKEGSVYRVLHSFTEREDRSNCGTTGNTCCKTESITATLNVQRDLALGFLIPAVTGDNALYTSNTTMSLGFEITSTVDIVSNTDIGNTIAKASISGDPQQINNQRFSVNFETESSSLATTAATVRNSEY